MIVQVESAFFDDFNKQKICNTFLPVWARDMSYTTVNISI